jgi:cytochrome c-type biogenesis protein CcmE
MKTKRWTYVLGAVLLLGFAGFSLASFRSALTPYVDYGKAREGGRAVQVAGALVAGSSSYDDTTGLLHFTLHDEETGQTLPVRYEGLKPANFEEAISIVAIGTYDEASGELAANKLLVKCPSKYQGAEVKEYS